MFKFELNTPVVITRSSEKGVITGRAEYTEHPHSYLVEYTAADGRAVEGWFKAREIEASA